MMMQFACTARSADDEDYRPLAETPLTLDFAYDHGVSTLADPAVWQVTLTNNADAPWRGVVKLEHCVACDAPRFFLPDSSTAAIAAKPRSALTTATQGCGQVHRSFLHRLGGWSALIASATPQPSCWTADGGMGSRLRHISCAKTACCNPGSPAGRERSHSLQALPAH
ncbi:MAG: hypothetical protein ACLSVH_07170 [Gemmiger formicilis]